MADNKTVKLKTYILQFTYKDGNGYAIVNATSPTQAEKVFLTQTRYKGATVVNLKESKWYGENMQVVYEGAVTTYANISVNVDLDALIQSGSLYRTFEDWARDKLKLDDYVTEEELKQALAEIDVTDLLSNYYTKQEVEDLIPEAIMPIITIDPTTLTWVIDGKSTQISAQGPAGDKGTFEDLTEEQKESLRGPAGKGISSVITQFTRTTTASTTPTGWGTTPQSPNETYKFLWSRLVITYNDNTTFTSTPYIVGNYSSSSSGGGINVDIAVAGQTEFNSDTIYFFQRDPLQSVGLYNTLLQEGQIDNDIYSPATLYSIDRDVNYTVNYDDSLVSFDKNVVYYDSQPTTLKRFGSVLLSSEYKYAESLLEAHVTFNVSGPFYTDITYVKITFSDDIKVLCKVNSEWVEKESGDVFEFTYNDFFIPRNLRIIRTDIVLNSSNTEVTEYLEESITFESYCNYDEYTETKICKVRFNKGRLLFSTNLGINNIETSQYLQDNVLVMPASSSALICGENSPKIGMDQRNFNKVYVNFLPINSGSYNGIYIERCSIHVFLDGWNIGSSNLPVCYSESKGDNSYYNIEKWGYLTCSCNVHDVDIKRYTNLITNINQIQDGVNYFGIMIEALYRMNVYEIGVMNYDKPEL